MVDKLVKKLDVEQIFNQARQVWVLEGFPVTTSRQSGLLWQLLLPWHGQLPTNSTTHSINPSNEPHGTNHFWDTNRMSPMDTTYELSKITLTKLVSCFTLHPCVGEFRAHKIESELNMHLMLAVEGDLWQQTTDSNPNTIMVHGHCPPHHQWMWLEWDNLPPNDHPQYAQTAITGYSTEELHPPAVGPAYMDLTLSMDKFIPVGLTICPQWFCLNHTPTTS